ncbi:hypothetical protein ACJRO7_022798 [Eucalyptus globulus]|uniref:Uncharacterized protein n=1 Tax=Eucalyptus globulus TaxID=34317 RepID=A0ABD3K008_EUCGL
MELASFSHPHIQALGKKNAQAALDARVPAKRLGPDVREGKRRQFNFVVAASLREVEPVLMDALIEAMKDGDHRRLQALSVSEVCFGEDDDEGEEDFEQEHEEEEEECSENASIASRCLDGLISKDIQIANEVFSIHTIDFDRQLQKLESSVHSIQEQPAAANENEREASMVLQRAHKSITRFLGNLARQLPSSNI